MQPTVLLNFILKLPGSPPRIAQGEDGAGRAVPAGDRLENIQRGGQADAFIDRQGRIFDKEIGRMQNKTASGLDRSALENLYVFGTVGQLNALGSGNDFKLNEEIGKFDVLRGMIDDDAHGAFGRVGTYVDHRTSETLVGHCWHRNQHLPIKITASG